LLMMCWACSCVLVAGALLRLWVGPGLLLWLPLE
jgi:hypothetical protein